MGFFCKVINLWLFWIHCWPWKSMTKSIIPGLKRTPRLQEFLPDLERDRSLYYFGRYYVNRRNEPQVAPRELTHAIQERPRRSACSHPAGQHFNFLLPWRDKTPNAFDQRTCHRAIIRRNILFPPKSSMRSPENMVQIEIWLTPLKSIIRRWRDGQMREDFNWKLHFRLT